MIAVSFATVTVAIAIYALLEGRIILGHLFSRGKDDATPGNRRRRRRGNEPRVTVQLPLYNERTAAVELIRTVANFDYPKDRFDIQVLDDSDDGTSLLVANEVQALKARGFSIDHIHRNSRDGWKAGALAYGLARSRSPFVAIFDADFQPDPSFLKRVLLKSDAFEDPKVAFVQARWAHTNKEQNFLTRVQAIFLDRHFYVQKPYLRRAHGTTTFNGSGGIWRREAIDSVGGWSADTLCEDMDLSYRCALGGWVGHYDETIAAPSEIPAHMRAFKQQQRRWAKGSAQCANKLIPQVLGSSRLGRRSDDLFVLLGYVIHPMMLVFALLWPWFAHSEPSTGLLMFVQTVMALAPLVGAFGFALTVVEAEGRLSFRSMIDIGLGTLVGIGLMVNNAVGFISGLTRNGGVFERTPKQSRRREASPAEKDDYALNLHWTVILECGMALYCLVAAVSLFAAGRPLLALPSVTWALGMGVMIFAQLRPQVELGDTGPALSPDQGLRSQAR